MRSLQNGASMYPYYGFLKCPFCGKPMIKIPIAGAVDGNAWVCGGEGPHQRLSEKSHLLGYKDSRSGRIWLSLFMPKIYRDYHELCVNPK